MKRRSCQVQAKPPKRDKENKKQPPPRSGRFVEGDQYIGSDPLPPPVRDRYWEGGRN